MAEITKSAGTLETLDFSGDYQVEWSDINNVNVSDNSYATAVCSGNRPYQIKATNFGFGIPAGATITGYNLEVEGKTSTGSVYLDFKLYKTSYGAYVATYADTLETVEGIASFGDTSIWTPAEINSSDFGIGVGISEAYTGTLSIDHLRVTITYTGGDSILSNISSISNISQITL